MKSRLLAVRLALLAVFMLGLSFAAVPLYDLFCRVTGWGGATNIADGTDVTPIDQTINVRFDVTLAKELEMQIRPSVREVTLQIGEVREIHYLAHNPTDQPVATMASFNVTPFAAGGYFTKIQCFCFTEQVIPANTTVEMPVIFYVDPEIVSDPEGSKVKAITLSYSFYAA